MDERWAEMKPGRSRRTDAPEPVETKTGGIDAFPRNGVAGPGCQAATVADGRRETETGVARWRKCASWMQGEGREVEKLSIRTTQFHQIPIKCAAFDENLIISARKARSY